MVPGTGLFPRVFCGFRAGRLVRLHRLPARFFSSLRPSLARRAARRRASSPPPSFLGGVLRVFCECGCVGRLRVFLGRWAFSASPSARRRASMVRACKSPARLVCCAGLVWRIG